MRAGPLLLAACAALTMLTGCVTGSGSAVVASSSPVTLDCGQATITATWLPGDDAVAIRQGGEVLHLRRALSASGARFEDEQRGVVFWNKGDTARFTIAGENLPLCLVPGAIEAPFVARGNEPFWRLEVDHGRMVLSGLDRSPLKVDHETAALTPDMLKLRGGEGANAVSATITTDPCQDSMSGMMYPRSVRLSVGDQVLTGCGGDPVRLLAGVEWQVHRIDGDTVMTDGLVTIRFFTDPDGNRRLVGRASCNRYTGSWQLTGEGLTLSGMASTRRACVPTLMAQEAHFLALLAAVTRFELSDSGSLWLITGDGRRIEARQ